MKLSATSGGSAIDITAGGAAGNVLCKIGDLCPANYHVEDHKCKPCASYYENAAGDDVHHQDTKCTKKMCTAGQYVKTKACVACPPGETSTAAWMGGGDTHCH